MYLFLFHESFMQSCTFVNNTATIGGAVSCETTTVQILVVENSTFRSNTASISAGSLYLYNTSLNISESELSDSAGFTGSAIYFDGKLTVLCIAQTKIFSNHFDTHFSVPEKASSISVASAQRVFVGHSTFHDNRGGAIVLRDARVEIHSCVFHRNTGFYGGAITTWDLKSALVIMNTSFVGNKAPSGAAMLLQNRNTVIQSCYFADNIASKIPHVIKTSFSEIFLRLYDNVFCASSEKSYVYLKTNASLETVIGLYGKSPTNKAVIYFWQTKYQFKNNNIQLIDKRFLQNSSMPKIVDRKIEGINISDEFSPFASGKYRFPGQCSGCNIRHEILYKLYTWLIMMFGEK